MKQSVLMLFCVFMAPVAGAQNQYVIDSLKHELSLTEDPREKANILIELCWEYPWSKPDSAISYGLAALQVAQEFDLKEQEIYIISPLSEALCVKGNFAKALDLGLKALAMAEQLGNEQLVVSAIVSLSTTYFYSGDYQNALSMDKRLLKHLKREVPNGLDFEVWFFQPKMAYGFTGEAYYHLGKIDSALYYIRKSYEEDVRDKIHWSIPYFYLARIYSRSDRYDSSLYYYRRGVALSQNLTLDIVDGYIGIASVFNATHQIDSAIHYAKKAMVLAQKESLSPRALDAASLLSALYTTRNTDSAFFYQRVMVAAKDSLFSQEKMRQLENLTFNEQLRQREILEEQNELRSKQQIYSLLAGLSLFLVAIFFLWRNNQHKQRAFALLQVQKKETDFQKEKAEKALEDLKAMQSQLIQSEKMASLGELTAGIAHEIQNPLNFVNNFSEVNADLIDDLKKELASGNPKSAEEIADSIKKNEEKISHHGKRADGIVKSMLQHSRFSSGQKELTDINALCDEYMRLTYHGYRAKNKSFNAGFKTDFDASIPLVNVVTQDLGRVILNLLNNAFHAVSESAVAKAMADEKYEPTVVVSTRYLGNKIEIRVKDNGNGIRDDIKEKIFQPFFTTKPTGQGTGLGLSLSYDIIKAHAGTLEVSSKQGEGSEFIIQLPV
jgi:two-component system NtrC family sensor kinase